MADANVMKDSQERIVQEFFVIPTPTAVVKASVASMVDAYVKKDSLETIVQELFVIPTPTAVVKAPVERMADAYVKKDSKEKIVQKYTNIKGRVKSKLEEPSKPIIL